MGYLFMLFRSLHQAAIDARRRARTSGYVAWSFAAAVAVAFAIGCLLAVVASLWVVGLWFWAIVLLAVFLVPVSAAWLLRRVCVPLGWAKAAHALGRIATAAGTDPGGYALVVAAWAALSGRRTASAETIAWIERQREARGALGDAEVIASALLLARTDAPAARELLASVPELVERHPAARELAGEYLAVEAAERGAWRELLPSESASWPASPLRFFLEGLAAMNAGSPGAPTRWGLAARWVVAPRRRQTWALWREMLGHGAGAAASAGPASEAPGHDAAEAAPEPLELPHERLYKAMRYHVAILAAPRPDEDSLEDDESKGRRSAELESVVGAWSAALSSPELLAWAQGRALELGAQATAARRAIDEVQSVAVGDLRAYVEAFRLPMPKLAPGPFGAALGTQLRHGRLADVELAFDHWAARVDGGAALAPIDEWREFLAVRRLYRDLVSSSGDDVRRLVFAHVFEAANKVAVILWNSRAQYVLAHAILCWQRDEALTVGDSAAIELATKNCKLRVQTRTGDVTP